MDNNLFRKKSLQSIESPEKLDEYIRVINAPLWLIIAAIAILLAGIFIWASVDTIETRTTAYGAVLKGELTCRADAETVNGIANRLEKGEDIVVEVNGSPALVTGADKEVGLICADVELPDCLAEVVIFEKIRPVSLLFK